MLEPASCHSSSVGLTLVAVHSRSHQMMLSLSVLMITPLYRNVTGWYSLGKYIDWSGFLKLRLFFFYCTWPEKEQWSCKNLYIKTGNTSLWRLYLCIICEVCSQHDLKNWNHRIFVPAHRLPDYYMIALDKSTQKYFLQRKWYSS